MDTLFDHPSHVHGLTLVRTKRNDERACDLCSADLPNVHWGCLACSFDLCTICFNKGDEIICSHSSHNSHYLIQFQFSEEDDNYIYCDLCEIEILDTRWSCSRCDFDLCGECYAKGDNLIHHYSLRSSITAYAPC